MREAEAIDAVSVECFRSFATLPNASLLDVDGVEGVITDVPLNFFNGVAATRGGASIAGVIERFRHRRAPFRWWISPLSEPADLPALLRASGMRQTFTSTGMTADLSDLRETAMPAGVRIAKIEDRQGLEAWAGIFAHVFNRAPEEAALWLDTYLQLGFTSSWIHFVAYRDDVPVATTSLLLAGEVAGIYHVATLPSARGRGIGAAITAVAMRHAREAGATIAALQASTMGLGVYRSVGFTVCCDLTLYDWRP